MTRLDLFLPDDTATTRLGQCWAEQAGPGMTLLLSGQIGAGKTHFARALIQSRLGAGTEVPSPSFTLIQTYEDDRGDIWHVDLYRLSHPDEVIELGLEAAFSSAICLIEWPDRLGKLAPQDAIRLEFYVEGDGRRVVMTGPEPILTRLSDDWGRA
ncbi:tRNA (adenosine(37)-N6)-threonylcarbamoyltransferase complex ATPase subunit type 1 TsaE [Gemmobacter denitrificans]|uniref:tRNA threonylcarbamoyladenosine biosynthesis protein TsaE n=1 Tax=Gemmobacter denitrificans TaxID=3123040 RepID=A0ABU8BX83_9RHOB